MEEITESKLKLFHDYNSFYTVKKKWKKKKQIQSS